MDRYFHNDAIGIIETDADYKIIRVNRGARKMFGFSTEEFMQRTWMDLTHPEDVERAKDHFEDLFESGLDALSSRTLDLRCQTKTGRPLFVALNFQAGDRDPNGRPRSYVGFILDVSQRKRADQEVEAANNLVKQLHYKIGRALSDALGSRDQYTSAHQNHAAQFTERMCILLGMSAADRQIVIAAANLHDIGKIGIPIEYLTKPGKLDETEMALIRTHVQRGFDILRPMDGDFPIAEIVYQHHERLDGSGYPRGLSNGAVLPAAQIISAADTADSIIRARPYRAASGKEFAIKALTEERGIRIHADIIDACIATLHEMP